MAAALLQGQSHAVRNLRRQWYRSEVQSFERSLVAATDVAMHHTTGQCAPHLQLRIAKHLLSDVFNALQLR